MKTAATAPVFAKNPVDEPAPDLESADPVCNTPSVHVSTVVTTSPSDSVETSVRKEVVVGDAVRLEEAEVSPKSAGDVSLSVMVPLDVSPKTPDPSSPSAESVTPDIREAVPRLEVCCVDPSVPPKPPEPVPVVPELAGLVLILGSVGCTVAEVGTGPKGVTDVVAPAPFCAPPVCVVGAGPPFVRGVVVLLVPFGVVGGTIAVVRGISFVGVVVVPGCACGDGVGVGEVTGLVVGVVGGGGCCVVGVVSAVVGVGVEGPCVVVGVAGGGVWIVADGGVGVEGGLEVVGSRMGWRTLLIPAPMPEVMSSMIPAIVTQAWKSRDRPSGCGTEQMLMLRDEGRSRRC